MKTWLVVLAMLLPLTGVAQGIYKWVDAQGQVHYGEAPPQGTTSSEVTLKNTQPPAAPAASDQERKEQTQRVLRAFEEERTTKAEQEAKAAKEKEERRVNCNIARDRLRGFEEAGAIYSLDENGERRVYNDAQHAAALQRARDQVAKYCN